MKKALVLLLALFGLGFAQKLTVSEQDYYAEQLAVMYGKIVDQDVKFTNLKTKLYVQSILVSQYRFQCRSIQTDTLLISLDFQPVRDALMKDLGRSGVFTQRDRLLMRGVISLQDVFDASYAYLGKACEATAARDFSGDVISTASLIYHLTQNVFELIADQM